MQDKSKLCNIHVKAPTPPQSKVNHKRPLKPSHMSGKYQVLNSKGSNQDTRFLNAKDHTPPEAKENHKLPLKWRTQGFIK
jgi:hypothetical protein